MLLDAVAPWIIDSWLEVLTALSFELPTLPLDPTQSHVVLALTGIVLLAFGWQMVGPMPSRARFAALSLLTLAMLSPLAVLTSRHLDEINRLPQFAGRFRKPAEPAAEPAIQTQRLPDSVALTQAPVPAAPPAISAPPLEVASKQEAPPNIPAQEVATIPPPVTVDTPLAPIQTAAATARKVVRQLSKLLPSDPGTGLIPVFYGTDRMTSSGTAHPAYSAEPASRLEVGHALVQIPRSRLARHNGRPLTTTKAQLDSAGGSIAAAPAPSANQFAIAGLKALSRDEFLEQAVMRLAMSERDKDHALVFVPGYNTSFDAALYRAAQIAYDLRFDGAPFVYSWPSNGATADYRHDTESVAKAAAYFAEFLRIVVQQTGAKTVSFIAHGLGTGLTLDALAAMKNKIPPGVTIAELILTAPDVDAATFKSRIASLAGLARRTTLYVASTDRALNISRRYTGGVPRAGDVLASGPLVIPGVDTIDVSLAGTQAVGQNHADYVGEAALIGHIATRLHDGQKSASVESVPTPNGPYQRLR